MVRFLNFFNRQRCLLGVLIALPCKKVSHNDLSLLDTMQVSFSCKSVANDIKHCNPHGSAWYHSLRMNLYVIYRCRDSAFSVNCSWRLVRSVNNHDFACFLISSAEMKFQRSINAFFRQAKSAIVVVQNHTVLRNHSMAQEDLCNVRFWHGKWLSRNAPLFFTTVKSAHWWSNSKLFIVRL